MNTFSLKYLTTLLILALFSLSCNEDALKDDEENTLFLEHAALLEGTWKVKDASSVITVSYTHLTLPTIYSV